MLIIRVKKYIDQKIMEIKKKITIYIKRIKIKKSNMNTYAQKKTQYKSLYYKMYANYTNKKIVLSSFFRKNKIYIKSKFSKSRAFTKNIVYFGLIINIIFMYELNLLYYNISPNFGYFIYPIYVVIIISSMKWIYKYKLIKNFFTNLHSFVKIYNV